MKKQARILISLLIVLGWITACVPQSAASQEPTPSVTPDPLVSINCIRHQGMNDMCYAGASLIGNTELLEKAAFDYCQNVAAVKNNWCIIYIWEDESSVAQSIPLSDADKASQLATFNRHPVSLKDCFKLYDQGQVTYESAGCTNWNK
jgi:hypothetical protein